MIERLVIGLAASAVVALLGWRARALTGKGALAAVLVGTAIAVGASWPGIAVLGTFFVSSTLLSRTRQGNRIAEKGSRRDAVQVLANGGVAAAAALGAGLFDGGVALAMVAGSLAAATADTWATEVGSSSDTAPRMLLSRRLVVAGESGGVTRHGTLAAFAGATFIASVAGVSGAIWIGANAGIAVAVVVLVAGVAGSTADSLAGELVQERRFCPVCGAVTEARMHHCGNPTNFRSGVAGVTNDVVNLICTLTGALVGAAVLLF